MGYQRIWTQEEDKTLRYLFQEQKIGKWSTVAQRMTAIFRSKGITGVKCKKRYLSLVPQKDTTNLHTSISLYEDSEINRLHTEVGNKWSVISRMMNSSGNRTIERTDNVIKNFFYSKLRKSLRNLNKLITQYYGEQEKPIGESSLYKIIEITGERFRKQSCVCDEIIEMSLRLKTWLYEFMDQKEKISPSEIKEVYEEINYLLQNCKKTAKSGNNSPKKQVKIGLPKLQKISRKKNMCFWDSLEEQKSVQIMNIGTDLFEDLSTIHSSNLFTIDAFQDNKTPQEEKIKVSHQLQQQMKEQNNWDQFLNYSIKNDQLPLRQSKILHESLRLFRDFSELSTF